MENKITVILEKKVSLNDREELESDHSEYMFVSIEVAKQLGLEEFQYINLEKASEICKLELDLLK